MFVNLPYLDDDDEGSNISFKCGNKMVNYNAHRMALISARFSRLIVGFFLRTTKGENYRIYIYFFNQYCLYLSK